MDRRQLFHYVLVGILLVLLYFAFLLVRPYATYLLFSFILAFLLHPVYRGLRDRTKRPRLASALILLAILIILILPSGLLITKLVKESVSAYNSLRMVEVGPAVQNAFAWTGLDANSVLDEVAGRVKDYFVSSAPDLLGSVAEFAFGLFLMFFLLYYAFIDGERWVKAIRQGVPMDEGHKRRLFDRIGSITDAVLYGQFLTSLIQGTLGGLLFLILGIPNPVFWGVIMVIMSFIPFLGTPIVFVPAAILEILNGSYVSGILLLVLGFVILINVDNVLKPYLISSKDKLNPVLVVIGVFGGLKLFGFIGILLGPLILALLQTVIEFFRERPQKASA